MYDAGSARPERALLLFVDGLGIGEPDPERNPFLRAEIPTIFELLGGLPLSGEPGEGRRWVAADARLGIDGLPQSGTGQTTLLTGINTPAILGRHFGPWVPTELRPLLAAENALTRVRDAGLTPAFANATPAAQGISPDGRWRRPAAPPLAAHAAGLARRDDPELRARRAVASSITNEKWKRYVDSTIPGISAPEAGEVLASISAEADLTLFAHYDLDFVGHRGSYESAVAAIERLDAFIAGLLAALDDATLVVIASDHGNVEDLAVEHTLNPVAVAAAGPGADRLLESVSEISDVAPAMLAQLGVAPRDGPL